MAEKYIFQTLDLGSAKPTSVRMQTILVELTKTELLSGFGKAFVNEAARVNPLRADQVKLTPEEMEQYCRFLLKKRIDCVNGECSDFHRLKSLYIPSWIQYNLSMIGRVLIRDKGIELLPVMTIEPGEEIISLEEALQISGKIGSFEGELQIVQDAMPRSIDGDKDVMSTALIADYVHSLEKVEHVASTYVTAFLGMKLKEEASFKALYRVQYDDYDFIASALLNHKGLY